jgi:hypothetical protein
MRRFRMKPSLLLSYVSERPSIQLVLVIRRESGLRGLVGEHTRLSIAYQQKNKGPSGLVNSDQILRAGVFTLKASLHFLL